ncbi:FCS-Like Zinc finger 6-like [Nymphaea colorata]|nr:FCS-Like Zinc finger 6-like [Nymphaea colorata]
MLLGKRSRPSMRRTTSLTEFELNLEFPPSALEAAATAAQQQFQQKAGAAGAGLPSAGVPQRSPRRSSADFLAMEGAAHFLRCCTLCKRRIGPGRDIYMYKGDTAYCSLECRQQQMNIDERKEKCSMTSMKKKAPPSGCEPSGNGETAVAA